MLMKQQDRLEEREQDIEDQLYKLESDKRLVEVAKPKPLVWGEGTLGTGPWASSFLGLGSVAWSALCQKLLNHWWLSPQWCQGSWRRALGYQQGINR